MAPWVEKSFHRTRQAGLKSYDIISRLLGWTVSVFGIILDAIYDRLDLWQNKNAKVASYKKIRSLVLYTAVVFVDVYVVIHSPALPVTFLLWSTLGMLAASFGENVLLSFFEVLKFQRLGGNLGAVQMFDSPGRDPVKGIDPPTEQPYAPGSERF